MHRAVDGPEPGVGIGDCGRAAEERGKLTERTTLRNDNDNDNEEINVRVGQLLNISLVQAVKL